MSRWSSQSRGTEPTRWPKRSRRPRPPRSCPWPRRSKPLRRKRKSWRRRTAVNDDYERIARETAEAMETVAQAAAHLAQQEVTWKSEDRRITVRVTAGGTLKGL